MSEYSGEVRPCNLDTQIRRIYDALLLEFPGTLPADNIPYSKQIEFSRQVSVADALQASFDDGGAMFFHLFESTFKRAAQYPEYGPLKEIDGWKISYG